MEEEPICIYVEHTKSTNLFDASRGPVMLPSFKTSQIVVRV